MTKCETCKYMRANTGGSFSCVVDPPQILGLDAEGRFVQRDPRVHPDRPACKYHMTEDQAGELEPIWMK